MTSVVMTPDLSRVPRVLELRLSDEHSWASETWGSDCPASLAAGIRRAWADRIERARPGAGHPALALRRRLAEIDRWLEERRARAVATEDARRSWEAQAVTWRIRAEREFGAGDWPELHLQVRGPSGHWLGPSRHGAGPTGPRVSATVTTQEIVERAIWEHARLAWAHDAMIAAFASEVAADVARPALVPVPALPEET